MYLQITCHKAHTKTCHCLLCRKHWNKMHNLKNPFPSSKCVNKMEYYKINIYFWFKYDLGQKYYAPQVRPDQGSNSWHPDHDNTFHVTETPALGRQWLPLQLSSSYDHTKQVFVGSSNLVYLCVKRSYTLLPMDYQLLFTDCFMKISIL